VWGLVGCLQKDKLCVKIVLSGSVSAGLPCSWLDVEIQCRVTRQLVCDEAHNSIVKVFLFFELEASISRQLVPISVNCTQGIGR